MALTSYTITGRVVDDSTRELLAGVEVQILNSRTKTDERGVYSITVELDEVSRPKIIFKKKEYVAQSVTPFRRSGRVITNLKQVRLERLQNSLDEEVPRALLAPEEAYDELRELFPKDPKQALINAILKQVMNLYAILIPTIIGLLVAFGISSLKNLVGRSCPTNSKLRSVIAKKNNLVRQLNNVYKATDAVAKTVAGITALITAIKAAIKVILKLPIPQAVPPGIGIPVGLTTTFSNTVTKIEKKLDGFQNLSAATLGALILLRAAIGIALKYLSVLDSLIQECVAEANGSINLLPEPDFWEPSIIEDETGRLIEERDYLEGDKVKYRISQGGEDGGEIISTVSIYVCNTDHTATETGVTGPPGIGDYWDQLSVVEQNGIQVPQGVFLETLDDNGRFIFKDALGRSIGDNTTDLVPGGTDINTIQLPGEEPITQEQLSVELQIIRAKTTLDGQPKLTEVNGFIMDVQDDEKNQVGTLKRRYAVAKNKNGVILLKGEPSLSSSDQILIDELAFYIQQNDLKPN